MRLPAATVAWTEIQQRHARLLLTDSLCLLAGANEVQPSAEKRAAIDELNEALGLPATRWPTAQTCEEV